MAHISFRVNEKIRANFYVVLHRVNNGALSSCHFFRLLLFRFGFASRATLYFLFVLNKFSRYERGEGFKFTSASISVHRNGLINGLETWKALNFDGGPSSIPRTVMKVHESQCINLPELLSTISCSFAFRRAEQYYLSSINIGIHVN